MRAAQTAAQLVEVCAAAIYDLTERAKQLETALLQTALEEKAHRPEVVPTEKMSRHEAVPEDKVNQVAINEGIDKLLEDLSTRAKTLESMLTDKADATAHNDLHEKVMQLETTLNEKMSQAAFTNSVLETALNGKASHVALREENNKLHGKLQTELKEKASLGAINEKANQLQTSFNKRMNQLELMLKENAGHTALEDLTEKTDQLDKMLENTKQTALSDLNRMASQLETIVKDAVNQVMFNDEMDKRQTGLENAFRGICGALGEKAGQVALNEKANQLQIEK